MSLPTFTDSQWLDIVNASDITTTRWNALKNDIKATIQAIDRTNVTDAGLLPADTDGAAMTLADGAIGGNSGEQTVTRSTKFSTIKTSPLTLDGTIVYNEVQEDCTDTTPSASGVARILFTNDTAGAVSLIGLADGVEGQEVIVITNPDGANNITFTHGTDTGDFYLDNGADVVHTAADPPISLHLRYTDLNSYLTNFVWMEIGRSNLKAPVP